MTVNVVRVDARRATSLPARICRSIKGEYIRLIDARHLKKRSERRLAVLLRYRRCLVVEVTVHRLVQMAMTSRRRVGVAFSHASGSGWRSTCTGQVNPTRSDLLRLRSAPNLGSDLATKFHDG